MNRLFLIIGLMTVSSLSFSQSTTTPDPILYGIVQKEALLAAPYAKWYAANYDSYQPESNTVNALKKLNTKDISIEIYFGTWCGDSRREVPRFMKLLNELSFSDQRVKIIGVGGSDSLYKQSPQHEDAGKGIFRVPAFIVYKNGVEVNRINEYPAYSLEKDLYTILAGKTYTPNYRSLDMIRGWLADGTLADKNNNTRGLAMQIKSLVNTEFELNSLGYLLQKQGMKEQGLRVFQINASLYPESSNVLSSLGEGYYNTGDNKLAVQYLERSLELNRDPAKVKEILAILYKAKGVN